MKRLFSTLINDVVVRRKLALKQKRTISGLTIAVLLFSVWQQNVQASDAQKASASIQLQYPFDTVLHRLLIKIDQGAVNTEPGITKLKSASLGSANNWIIQHISLEHHKDVDLTALLKLNGKSVSTQSTQFVPFTQAPLSGPKSIMGDTVTFQLQNSKYGVVNATAVIKASGQ